MASRFNLSASAVRFGDTVVATVHATLPDGCHDAEVTDIYPGGNIVYVVDPGEAQVFVSFTRGPGPCPEAIREWEAVRDIPDTEHDALTVIAEFEGERFTVCTRVEPFALAPDIDPGFNPAAAGKFIVIALVANRDTDRPIGCRVIRESATYPMNYMPVFGPAPRAECEIWRSGNCGALQSESARVATTEVTMSRESDVQDCLAEAIFKRINAHPSPGDFNTATPAALLYEDGRAWLATLRDAANCLRNKGYQVAQSTVEKATALRTKTLVHSQAYLEGLISS
jgi:hypothetical protein